MIPPCINNTMKFFLMGSNFLTNQNNIKKLTKLSSNSGIENFHALRVLIPACID